MRTEFRKVHPQEEIRSLLAFDRKVFPPSDLFDSDYWRELESHWMLIDGVKVGCCAFEKDVDFQEDIRQDAANPQMEGSLFIATTGILPRFRGFGLGQMFKCWHGRSAMPGVTGFGAS